MKEIAPELLTVDQAIAILDAAPVSPRVVRIPLAEAMGWRLARDIAADRDYPPFDKSLMDGFAVRGEDVKTTPARLKVAGEVAAGQRYSGAVGPGQAVAIMTGAPLPDGADTVVPIEDCRKAEGEVVIHAVGAAGKFIARCGADCAAGAVVLKKGTRLEAAQLAVAASVGAAQVDVFDKPQVVVLSTGDELVEVDQSPGPSKIRNSNNVMLGALLKRLGCGVTDIGFVRDDPEKIMEALAKGLESDAIFVTGGMSMGEYDFVPRILREIGADLKITKLKIKPGKPFVFGIKGPGFRGQGSGSGISGSQHLTPDSWPLTPPSFVFGLPGNPVSSFVCTLRLCSRVLARMSGVENLEKWRSAPLAGPLEANGPREFYQPAILDDRRVAPLKWKGSADIYTLSMANALIVRPENAPAIPAGQIVRVLEIPT